MPAETQQTVRMPTTDKQLTVIGHLEELRARIIRSVAVLAAAVLVSCPWAGEAVKFLIRPVGTVTFIAPAEAFVATVTVAFFMGLFASFPFILYQCWAFVSAGLTGPERRMVGYAIPCSVALFFAGAAFAYAGMVPIALRFLLSFSSHDVVPMITVGKYLSFVGGLVFSFGIVFQMPLAVVVLTRVGVVTPRMLTAKRRHAIVVIFIASAFLSPPDCITQILLAVPLMVLYELSVVLSKAAYRGPEPYAKQA